MLVSLLRCKIICDNMYEFVLYFKLLVFFKTAQSFLICWKCCWYFCDEYISILHILDTSVWQLSIFWLITLQISPTTCSVWFHLFCLLKINTKALLTGKFSVSILFSMMTNSEESWDWICIFPSNMVSHF